MKLLERISIYGMSVRQSDAISEIKSLSKNIADNLLKCLVYGKCNAYNHWIEKLSAWFASIGKLTLKPDGRRFSKEEYEDLMFGAFGSNPDDLWLMLESFKAGNDKRDELYADFEIDRALITNVYACIGDVKDKTSLWFSNLKCNETVETVEVKKFFHSILDAYCD